MSLLSAAPRRGRWFIFCALVVALCLLPAGASANPLAPGSTDGALRKRLWLPAISTAETQPVSENRYELVPIGSAPTGLAAAKHPDLNLALRGYAATTAPLSLVSYNGGADTDAPQLADIFSDNRTARFTSVHRVYNWDWGCNCRGGPLTDWPVTLLGLQTRNGEPLAAPARGPEIYSGGYKALVLYADESRITLKYTRDDNVIGGYTVHLERLSLDPNLLALYRQADAAGRHALPALRDGQPLGIASGSQVLVAVRDCGSFLDPRSRKDWWQGR